MVRRARPDLQELYSDVFPDWTILDYFYHCNTQPARYMYVYLHVVGFQMMFGSAYFCALFCLFWLLLPVFFTPIMALHTAVYWWSMWCSSVPCRLQSIALISCLIGLCVGVLMQVSSGLRTEVTVLCLLCFVALCSSGEIAMKALNLGFGWAARPILPRIMELDKKLKVSFIYGEDSWMDPRSGYSAKYILGTGRVTVDLVPDVGHHVYSSAKRFNSIVLRRCSEACR